MPYQYTWCITGISADHSPPTTPVAARLMILFFLSKWPFQRAPCQSIKTCTTGRWKRCRWFRSPGGFLETCRSLAHQKWECYLGVALWIFWMWKNTIFGVENTPNRWNIGVQQAALFNLHQSTMKNLDVLKMFDFCQWSPAFKIHYLVGRFFTNPLKTYVNRQIGSWNPGYRVKIKKCLKQPPRYTPQNIPKLI